MGWKRKEVDLSVRPGEPEWTKLSKSEAIRQAQIFVGDWSPVRVIRFLSSRGVEVFHPQASKVLIDLKSGRTVQPRGRPRNSTLVDYVRATLDVQEFLTSHLGVDPDQLLKRLDDLAPLFVLVGKVGGVEVLRAILTELAVDQNGVSE